VLTDLDTLITALYVKIDDCLPRRRRLGRPPRLSDAELITLAIAQALLGISSEARWLRIAATRLAGAFPFLPGQPAYNRRLRAAGPLIRRAIRLLARDTNLWHDDGFARGCRRSAGRALRRVAGVDCRRICLA